MRLRERNGVSVGQPVRDLDGTSLGRVVALYDQEFLCRRRFLGREFVVRYDEIRAVRDGDLVVSRSARDLFELAAGEVPRSWRIPTPAAFPTAATPQEARDVRQDAAAGRVPGAALDEGPEHAPADLAREPPPAPGEELRVHVAGRAPGTVAPRSGSDRR